MRIPPAVTVLLAALAFCHVASAASLKELAREYASAKKSVGGAADKRRKAVKDKVAPILQEIGKVDSDESLGFLIRELDGALPEVAAACAPAILLSSKAEAVSLLLNGFARRPPVVKAGILEALGKTERNLKESEAEILRVAKSVKTPAVMKQLPAVLGKVDSPAAAKVMLSFISSPRRGRGPSAEAERDYKLAAAAALKSTANDEVKKWLADGAFAAARSNPNQLEVVAGAAGKLKLESARRQLEKLADHKSVEVASAAVDALAAIGAEPSVDTLKSVLEKRKGRGELSLRVRTLDAVARAGTEAAMNVVLEFARGKDLTMRAVAMGSLGLIKDPNALAALLDGLKSEHVHIRSTALTALTGKQEKPMVPALIEYLGTETEQRLQIDGLRLLVGLTGHNMGLVVADWRKWWDIAGPEFKFPEERKASASTDLRVIKADEVVPKYFGLETSSKKLGFIVDVSSSMTQEVETKAGGKARKIDILKKELANVVTKLSADTRLNVILFDRNFRSWQNQLQPLSGSGRSKVVKFVKGINTGSGTNVFDTLEFALKDNTVDTIYLLTDGVPTAGRIQDPEGILREVKVLNRVRGVTIHCIAFGEESKLLEELAAQNKGEYRFVNRY